MSVDILSNQTVSESERFAELVHRGMTRAIKAEVAELRRLKLPIIRSVNGVPVDCNPDTNPNAPPWSAAEELQNTLLNFEREHGGK
jgi:hypothetical protein